MINKKDHYYSFAVIMGNEDTHILPHPSKKSIKWIVFRLEDVIEQLLEDNKLEWDIKDKPKK